MTIVQRLNNLYLSLGDPNFNYGDANSKIRNIVIAEPVISDEFCENFLRITSSADISLCSQNENEESSDWAGGEIQVSSCHWAYTNQLIACLVLRILIDDQRISKGSLEPSGHRDSSNWVHRRKDLPWWNWFCQWSNWTPQFKCRRCKLYQPYNIIQVV